MAIITIEYDDGTVAHWEVSDETVEEDIEPLLGSPNGMRC
jgi:hypothetical protein